MKISLKIFILAVLFFIIPITTINATSISMNLENLVQNTENFNQVETSNINNIENNNDSANENNIEENLPKITSSQSSSDDEFLTIENILSIILIVMGILLVFFAIAILVRFK